MAIQTRHLRPVPDQTNALWNCIEERHLQRLAERLRNDAMEAATKATILGEAERARHFSRAVTHLNEAVNR